METFCYFRHPGRSTWRFNWIPFGLFSRFCVPYMFSNISDRPHLERAGQEDGVRLDLERFCGIAVDSEPGEKAHHRFGHSKL